MKRNRERERERERKRGHKNTKRFKRANVQKFSADLLLPINNTIKINDVNKKKA
jgi:hypothetical protein